MAKKGISRARAKTMRLRLRRKTCGHQRDVRRIYWRRKARELFEVAVVEQPNHTLWTNPISGVEYYILRAA